MENILIKTTWIILLNLEFFSLFFALYGVRKHDVKGVRQYVALVATNALATIILSIYVSSGVLIIIVPAMIFINQLIYWDITFGDYLGLFMVAFFLITFVENFGEWFLENFLNLNEMSANLGCSCFIISTIWLFYYFVGKRMNRNVFRLPIKINMIISVILFIFNLVYSYFIFVLSEILELKQSSLGIALIETSGIVIVILMFVFVYILNTQREFKIEKEILENFNKQQKKHFDIMMEKENKTREFRHDIIAVLLQIRNYSDKQNYNALNSYVDDVLGEISDISRFDYNVGNDVVNVILNYYLVPFKDKCKIEVIGFVDEIDNISEKNLCILISNLISNAIEAVEVIAEEERYIRFEIKKGKINTYIIVKNTFDKDSLDINGSKISTSKKDKINHGFGLKKIKNIVDEENGQLSIDYKGDIFCTEIMFPNG